MNSHPTLKPDYRTLTLKPGDAVALLPAGTPTGTVVKDRGDGAMIVKDANGAEWVYPRTRLVKTPTAPETPTAAEVADPDAVPGPYEVTLTTDEAAAVLNRIMNPTYTPPVAEQLLLAGAAQRMAVAVLTRG